MTIADRSDLSQLQAVDDDIDVTHVLEGADDSTLLTMARRGSAVALATLFARYRQPAERYARHLGLGAEADDVVSETFAQILDLLGRAKGPETAFRAYLFTSVRHESARRAKIRQRVISTGEADDLDQPVPFGNGEIDLFERGIVRNAYHSLPERWRAILWQLDVEGRSPREVGENQNMSPNAVSALAYRARSGLRESYLKQHVSDRSILDADCDPVREGMAAVVRGTAPKRMRDRVLGHLESCSSCHGDFEELTEVNRELGADFDPEQFAHVARFDEAGSCIEMRLRSLVGQRVTVTELDLQVDFAEGEDLRTEISTKFRPDQVRQELRDAGLDVRAIDDLTGFPEIMDGRVKTLNPRLYAGLLALRDNPEHMAQAAEHDIEFVDLVCVNLYPFERTVARAGVPDAEVIENIDIGGPTMIRAAAKNHGYAAVVTSPASYDAVIEELTTTGGTLSPETVSYTHLEPTRPY